MLREVKIRGYHIVDVHEISSLPARDIAVTALEKLDPSVRSELPEVMESHRCHAALVRLTRTINVEVPKADNRRF